jgi:glycosyltransferase involved in cell wall biosynthesis
MKHITFTVTNDLSYDQRMDRICTALSEHGYECTLIGRALSRSAPLPTRAYQTRRLSCWFERGKLFYLEYNLRLFFTLLAQKTDIICSIDLDTCLPGYAASRLRQKHFTFDSHEYFSELEEVVSRPLVHFIWQKVEAFIMKRARHAYTISEGYARLFRARYQADFEVVRNVPVLRPTNGPVQAQVPHHMIYQGALNVGRGLEESIEAMKHFPSLELHIYGDGPMRKALEELTRSLDLSKQVLFMGAVAPDVLRERTAKAWAGLTLFSETGLHHQYSLANRFFDYIHAGIPQLAMDYEEYSRFNEAHDIAVLLPELSVEAIVQGIRRLQNETDYQRIRANCAPTAEKHHWKMEQTNLIRIYQNL